MTSHGVRQSFQIGNCCARRSSVTATCSCAATATVTANRAVALLNEALAYAKESGMRTVERDCERLLASAGG